MSLIKRNPMLVCVLFLLITFMLTASMEFSGSYAWFVVKAEYGDDFGPPVIMMGKVSINKDAKTGSGSITNDSNIPIILRARVIIEPPENMKYNDFQNLLAAANFGQLWNMAYDDEEGLFINYKRNFGDYATVSKPTFDDFDKIQPEQTITMPEPSGLDGCTISYIFETIQATPRAYNDSWKGDYR
jgi:hypothetical protein